VPFAAARIEVASATETPRLFSAVTSEYTETLAAVADEGRSDARSILIPIVRTSGERGGVQTNNASDRRASVLMARAVWVCRYGSAST